MADKQLILVVEGTAAMGPSWKTIVSDYLDKIIRSFCSNDMTTQKPTSIASGSTFELALVVFNTHGPYSGSLVQRSGWTRDMDNFFSWLSSITFYGGGWNDVATAEGLAEALMMFAIPQNGYRAEQNVDGKRHCILVSASNPYPLLTPVYRPAIENPEQGENGEALAENLLYDAETVSKWFGLCSVSLSVICPKPLPKLKAIYNAGKRNQMAADPAVDAKQPHYCVQISDNFMEALAALSRSGLAQSQNPATTSPPGSGPPTSVPPVNGYIMNRPSMSTGNVPQATVKIEPSTVTSMASGPAIPHMPSIPRAAAQSVPSLQASSPPSVSQEPTTTNENVPDLKPIIGSSISQPVRPVVAILNNISQARVALAGRTSLGLPSMGGNTIGMHMSNMISNGMTSNVPPSQTVLSSGQSGISTVTGSGSMAGASQPLQNSALGSFSTATSNVSGNSNLGISQPLTNLQGNVSNTMGQPVPGIGQGNVSAMTQSGPSMNPNMMSNLGSTGAPSGNGSMMPTPGMPQQVQPGMQSIGVNNSAANMPMSQQATASLQSSQSKYVKVWEGNLAGQRQGQPVFITRLEGYRNASASETLAANWPPTMQIVRLISQDHMNNKQYVGKADFLVFRAMNQHGFLAQLQEKKLCAVIQLPTQTLLLSVSDKACRLIGMLFPGEPSTVTSMASGPAIPHMPSIPRAAAQSVPSLQASSPPSVSQEPTTTNENVPDLKPIIGSSISQPVRPVVAILNNISQARVALAGRTSLGLPSMGGNTIGMHMSNMISNGMTSNVPPSQTVLSSGQSGISTVTGSGSMAGASQPLQNSALGSFSTATSNVSGNSNLGISQPLTNLQGNVSNTMGQPVPGIGQGNVSAMTQSGPSMNPNMMSNLGSTGAPSGNGSMMPTPGMPQQVQPGMQSIGVNNSAANMPMSQQATASLQSSQSKYVKVWEGNLAGQRQGQPVFITRLEGYRNASASETLAANWPPTMQIVRLISQDHMNNKQYVGKADFLVFRAMNQHGFLAQLQEKKLCAVIQLPTQTLLLSVSDKACRLIGMLFPGDMSFITSSPSREKKRKCGVPFAKLTSWTRENPGRKFRTCRFYDPVTESRGCKAFEWVDEPDRTAWQTEVINNLLLEKKLLEGEINDYKREVQGFKLRQKEDE